MKELAEGLQLMAGVVRGDRHEFYDRTVKLASEYFKFYTGEGIDTLLRRIERREDEKMFKQRKEITQPITVPILNSTKLPFQKVCRTKPTVQKIEGVDESRLSEISDRLAKFNGNKTLKDYLEVALIELNYCDPNAFIAIEFDDFDPNKEKATPYPVIVTSEQAVNYEYFNGILQYLISWQGNRLMGYFGENNIEFTELTDAEKKAYSLNLNTNDKEGRFQELADGVNLFIYKKRVFVVEIYEPKSDQIPAFRVGYIPDTVTKGVTMVGIFHTALPLLHKTLKINSELDLSAALVAHPQILAYQNPCTEPGCRDGQLPDGGTCKRCGGSGLAEVSTTVQDAILLRMPTDPEQIIDLEKMISYKSPPTDVIQWQADYVESLKKQIHQAIFNADTFTRSEISTTATEKNLERDNLDDTLFPFAQQYAQIWEQIVHQVAVYTDNAAGLIVQLEFPKQFKFRTLEELINELSAARQSGASSVTLSFLQNEINETLLADRPEELKKQQIKQQLNPFNGYSAEEIRYILTTFPLKSKAVAWGYNESIWEELEQEQPEIYEMAIQKIKALFDAKVLDFVARVDADRPAPAVNFGGI